MKKANKIVIDTNVWLSYFLSKRFDLLAQLILDSEYEIVTSEALITEIKEVITRPKFKKQITLPIETYITFHEQLTICKYIEKKFTGSPDPKDDFLFDLALQTNA